MKVKELIQELEKLDQDREIYYIEDVRGSVTIVKPLDVSFEDSTLFTGCGSQKYYKMIGEY